MQDPLTVGEAAERLKLSERSVWRLVKLGHLDTVKILGRRRIVAESLERMLREGTSETPTGS